MSLCFLRKVVFCFLGDIFTGPKLHAAVSCLSQRLLTTFIQHFHTKVLPSVSRNSCLLQYVAARKGFCLDCCSACWFASLHPLLLSSHPPSPRRWKNRSVGLTLRLQPRKFTTVFSKSPRQMCFNVNQLDRKTTCETPKPRLHLITG